MPFFLPSCALNTAQIPHLPRAQSGPVTGPSPDQVTFGAATLAGTGGVPVGAAVAIQSGDPAGHWEISGGLLVPSAAGQGQISGAYTLRFNTGAQVQVTVLPNGRTLARDAELQAILNGSVVPDAGETIYLRRGPFDTDAMSFFGQPSDVTYAPADPLVPFEIGRWKSHQGTAGRNVTLRGFLMSVPYDVTAGYPWGPVSAGTCALFNGGGHDIEGLLLEDFVIDGQLPPARELESLVIPTQNNTGIYLVGAQNVTIRRGTIRRVFAGVVMQASRHVRIEDLEISEFWGDAWVLQNGSEDCAHVTIRNCHSHTLGGNPSGYHMDWIQLQPQNQSTAIRDILVEGCTHTPGAVQPMAQVDRSIPVVTNIYSDSFTLDLQVENGMEPLIRPTGDMTITMPSAAANAGRQVVIRYNVGSGKVSFLFDGADTYEGGTPELTANGQFATFVSDGSSQWKRLPKGRRSWMVGRAASQTLGAAELGMALFVNARTQPVALTLPFGASGDYHVQRVDAGTHPMTVLPPPGGSLSHGGVTVPQISFVQGYGGTLSDEGGGHWAFRESTPTNQGFFGNRHPQAAGYYSNITLRGNIAYLLSGSSLLLQQNVGGLRYLNNTFLPTLYDDGNADGRLGRFEGVNGYANSITVAGHTARAWKNFTVGQLLLNVYSEPGTDIGSLALGRSDAENFADILAPYFNGTQRADYRPTTRSEVVTSALAKPGSVLALEQVGAAGTAPGTGYYDFDAGRVNLVQPAPVMTGSLPASGGALGVDGAIEISFDQFVTLATGQIVLRNITDDLTVETFDATLQTGDQGGALAVDRARLSITPGADLTAGKDYAIQITPGAVMGHYDTAFAGISDDSTFQFSADAGLATEFAAVVLDGAAAWTRSDDIGGDNATKFLFAFRGRLQSGVSALPTLVNIDNASDVGILCARSSSQGRITFGASNRVNVDNMFTIGGGTDTILMTIDTAAATPQEGVIVYKNGTRIDPSAFRSSSWTPGAALNFGAASRVDVFASTAAGREPEGEVEFLLFDFPDALPDLTQAHVRDRFTPGLIGADGSGPAGAVPAFYMTGDAAAWNSGVQLGTGGDFAPRGLFVGA